MNTLFSCLAGLDSRYSFVPRWRPPFISALAAEDRCHLNGLAMVDGDAPAFLVARHDFQSLRGAFDQVAGDDVVRHDHHRQPATDRVAGAARHDG